MLDPWVIERLADPVTKLPVSEEFFPSIHGELDARVFLRNTPGFKEWESGQRHYEEYETSGVGYRNMVEQYLNEIEYDRPTYEKFQLSGSIIDVGGGVGTVREFLDEQVEFVSIDPFASVIKSTPPAKVDAYSCLKKPLNFICGFAEFLPFQAGTFDWVHMRSMLDHVQIPDLALLEARRVLKPDGRLLIGMHVEGGKTGKVSATHRLTSDSKALLGRLGVGRWQDNHVWHPTVPTLRRMLVDNGFKVVEEYWQPFWGELVVYLLARSTSISAPKGVTFT